MSKERKSLRELAAESHQQSKGGIVCPTCGCRHFLVYHTDRGVSAIFRYKACRHCGHKLLTATFEDEHIVRNVGKDEDDSADDEEESKFGVVPLSSNGKLQRKAE